VRLYEFDSSDKLLVTKIAALSDQLNSDIKNGNISPNYTTDMLLDYFRKYNVILDKTDLYNMILTYPLKNIISNIQGDKVIFKGMPQQPAVPDSPSPEKSQEIVSKMAHKAAGK
jgi:hypothetical protein